ncbi:MAG: phenylalanine--tRNA ligase subunit beta [Clostridia bacterium]|nr:phenylalanine--tRNA ligase subunit beta [Clostridia bacterium]
MKLSLNWIKDFVDLPAELDLKRLAYDLTMSTVEVEGMEELARRYDGIIVGVIEEVLPHPNADKLRICRVDIGGEIKDIVCGGSNLESGMKVVVATPGAFVRWHGEGEPVEIKNAKLRGVESFGMICASVEVGMDGLFPAAEEHEIMDLSSLDVSAGTPLAEALGLDDCILEIDNKSMTNRPDLWGHYGIARELAALYDLPLKPIPAYVPETETPFDIRILDTERCPRYIGSRIEGLCVKDAPFEMRSRLWKVGLRPINALVDVTNYVMLAVGQPTHVFDADMIKGHIEVRRAKDGETLGLLNDKELKLTSDDLVIADAEEAVALAGVMGGAKDSVLPDTKDVILEVANFDARGVRRTAIRYDNRTESSARYEKAIDPERCDQALSLAMKIFKELYPDMKVTAFTDCYREHLERKEIDVPLEWLDRRLGMRIPKEIVERKLGTMGFEVTYSGDEMHVVVPTWRSTGDVGIKADIMEEVARMYGYDNFEATTITASFEGAINQLDEDLVRKVKEYLAFRCDMQEIFTYPWMSEEFVDATLPSTDGVLALSTPPSPEEKYLRSSMIPNICRAIVKNEHNYDSFGIFEEAKVFIDRDYTSVYPNEELPRQERRLGFAVAGSPEKAEELFRQAKGIIGSMPRYTHQEQFTFERIEKPYWSDDAAWLNICLGGKKIGDLGLISRKAAQGCGIKVLTAALAEIDLDSLVPFRSRTNRFEHIPEFPENTFDISFLVDGSVKWDEMKSAILGKKAEGSLLKDALFVDEYRGRQIPDGKKSVTVRLVIGSNEKTLTGAEIESVADSVMRKITHVMGAEVRSK